MQNLKEKFAAYLGHRFPEARDILVDRFERIHGGASRQTYRISYEYFLQDENVREHVIMRLDPPTSLVETDYKNEYNAYRAFQDTSVPVPKTLWIEENPDYLGGSFYMMSEISGCESSIEALAEAPYREVKEKIGESYAHILGQIARMDPARMGLWNESDMPRVEDCWQKELNYWEGMIDKDELEPQPIVRAVIRWLKRNPPPAAGKICVIHGDFRAGNFLYDRTGSIKAILDWEMCHLGDPIEDLTYGMNALWSSADPQSVGMMLPRERFLELWEESSGIRVSEDALKWWELFTSVKSIAIWIDAARKFSDQSNQDLLLAHTGLIATVLQNFIMLGQMGRIG
ncbi:MAG: phosphotransferase family protein [Deltaproteobacteria bacterium]|nr:phosphotransferase family protein [Deltaproteobacteria bacterium]